MDSFRYPVPCRRRRACSGCRQFSLVPAVPPVPRLVAGSAARSALSIHPARLRSPVASPFFVVLNGEIELSAPRRNGGRGRFARLQEVVPGPNGCPAHTDNPDGGPATIASGAGRHGPELRSPTWLRRLRRDQPQIGKSGNGGPALARDLRRQRRQISLAAVNFEFDSPDGTGEQGRQGEEHSTWRSRWPDS